VLKWVWWKLNAYVAGLFTAEAQGR